MYKYWNLFKFIGYISLIIPNKLVRKFNDCVSYSCGARLILRTQNKEGKCKLRPRYFIFGHKYMSIKSMRSDSGLRIECIDKYKNQTFSPYLEIGENVIFNKNCHIGVINKIIIGNNVLIGSNVLITDHSHGTTTKESLQIFPEYRELYSKGPVVIEDNVWIGENVSILPNVTIGKGAVIGANSVVTSDVPQYAVVCGVPAKLIEKK